MKRTQRKRATKGAVLSGIVAFAAAAAGLSPACGGESATDQRDPLTGGSGARGGQGGSDAGGTGTGGTGNGPAGGTQTTGGASGAATGGNGAAGAANGGGPGGEGAEGGEAGDPRGGVGGSPAAGMGGAMAGAGGSPAAGVGGTPLGGIGGAPPGGTGGGGGCAASCASTLNGHTILAPCGASTEARVCEPITVSGTCTLNDEDPALSGGWMHHETVTMLGTPGVMYDVTLHVQGEVEAKVYQGGTDQNSSGTQVPADGFYVGGVPDHAVRYAVYMIRVMSPRQDYFLNSVGAGTDTRLTHMTWITDYQATIRVEGGSPVLFHASDANCSMIKNCACCDLPAQCPNTNTVPNLDPLIAQDIGGQPYNGQFLGVTVVGVRTVN